jgi:hypothetical protein
MSNLFQCSLDLKVVELSFSIGHVVSQSPLFSAGSPAQHFSADLRTTTQAPCQDINSFSHFKEITQLFIAKSPNLSPRIKMSGPKKSLLIGINYTGKEKHLPGWPTILSIAGSENELNGCHQDVENVAEFISYRGYSSDPRSQVILRDDREGMYYPSGHNMLVNLPFVYILFDAEVCRLRLTGWSVSQVSD